MSLEYGLAGFVSVPSENRVSYGHVGIPGTGR